MLIFVAPPAGVFDPRSSYQRGGRLSRMYTLRPFFCEHRLHWPGNVLALEHVGHTPHVHKRNSATLCMWTCVGAVCIVCFSLCGDQRSAGTSLWRTSRWHLSHATTGISRGRSRVGRQGIMVKNGATGRGKGSRPARTREFGSVVKDLQQIQLKKDRAAVMKLLDEHPEQVGDVLRALQSGVFSPETLKTASHDSEYLPKTYTYFHQVPKYWLVAWLVKHGPTMFTTELAWAIDAADKDNLRCLLEFITGVRPSHKIPKGCLHLATLGITLEILAEKLGKRFTSKWVKDAVSINGEVNFAEHGAYKFGSFEGDRVVSLVNRAGVTVEVQDGVALKKTWAISHNFSDVQAGIHQGMINIVFSQHIEKFEIADDYIGNRAVATACEAAVLKQQEYKKNIEAGHVDAMSSANAKPKRAGPPPQRKRSARTMLVSRG